MTKKLSLIEELRDHETQGYGSKHLRGGLFKEAADEIERLRTVLDEIASWDEGPEVNRTFDEPGSAQKARDALAGSAPEPKPEFNPDTIPECPRCQVQHWPQCPEKFVYSPEKSGEKDHGG